MTLVQKHYNNSKCKQSAQLVIVSILRRLQAKIVSHACLLDALDILRSKAFSLKSALKTSGVAYASIRRRPVLLSSGTIR